MSVVAFPRYNLTNTVAALRQLANRIEGGEIDCVRCVVVMEAADGQPNYTAFGEDFTRAHAVGLLWCVAGAILPTPNEDNGK